MRNFTDHSTYISTIPNHDFTTLMNNSTTTLSQAQICFESGKEYDSQALYSEALKKFEQASALYRDDKEWNKYIECGTCIIRMLTIQIRHSEAEQVMQDMVLFATEKQLENAIEMAELYMDSSVLYAEMAEWEKCFRVCFLAEEICKSTLGNTSAQLGSVYTNLGAYYGIVRDENKSFQYIQKALDIFKVSEDLEARSMCYYLMGQYFEGNGQREESIAYYQKSLNIFLSLGKKKDLNVAMIYIYMGKSYVSQSEFEQGMYYFQNALEIVEELSDDLTIAFIYTCIGDAYQKRGKAYLIQERSYRKKAIQIHKKVLGSHHVKISSGYYEIAQTYIAEQEYTLAWSFNQKVFTALDANYGSKTKKLHKIAQDFLVEKKMFHNLFIFLEQRADILYRLYRQNKDSMDKLQESFNVYQLIGDLMIQFYDENMTKATKLRIRKEGKGVYEKNISIGLELQSFVPTTADLTSKIFEASEKSKAILLFSELQSTAAKLQAQIPAELLEEEQTLRKKWKELEKKCKIATSETEKSNDTQIAAWKSELFDLQRAHEKLVARLERDFPHYAQLKRELPIVSIQELQATLAEQPNLSIVSYFVGEAKIYAFFIQSNYFEVIEISKPTDLEEKILDFVEAIGQSFLEEYTELGYELYQLLIAPIRALSGEKKDCFTDSLLILPDDILYQLPFEALLNQQVSDATAYTDLPYLLLDYAIQYHYSASLWNYGLKTDLNKVSASPSNSFVGFAPVYANKLLKQPTAKEQWQTAYHEENTRSVRIRGKLFQELLYSEKEVKDICQLFEQQDIPTQTFLHEKASIPQLHKAISNHKYVHISAHSFPNPDEANLAGIIFSPSEEDATEVKEEMDYVFYLQDAYLLNLQADLVVLSCCETGIGHLAKGEGVLAMNRGFLAAGAKNVIYTLFKVYDAASCKLTTKLFRHILAGKSYAVALRLAKLEMLEGKTALPKFWAGYVMIGV